MLRIILSIMLFFGCLSANFFIVDNGIVMEIVNEPSTTNIVDSNGKTLKKHKSLYSANQSLKERQHPKKVKKVRKSTKKVVIGIKDIKNRELKKVLKEDIRKDIYQRKRVQKDIKKRHDINIVRKRGLKLRTI
jgi:Cu/Ag efflux protein CusF